MNKEEIKAKYSMREIVEKYGFRPNRANFIKCPFHAGDNSASLKIYDKDFHCFGCHKNGDIFTFAMEIENKSFDEVFKDLGGTYETHHNKAHKPSLSDLIRKSIDKKKEAEKTAKIEELERQLGFLQTYKRLISDKYRELNSIRMDTVKSVLQTEDWCEAVKLIPAVEDELENTENEIKELKEVIDKWKWN